MMFNNLFALFMNFLMTKFGNRRVHFFFMYTVHTRLHMLKCVGHGFNDETFFVTYRLSPFKYKELSVSGKILISAHP